jgi:hypothetical protein
VALNWSKFQHPYLFPLEKQNWTQLNEQRRLALAANGGDLVSLKIFPSTFINYFRPDGIRFSGVFPFIGPPAKVAPSYGGSYLDQVYRTASVVPFMPLLVLLCTWGLITAFRRKGAKGASLLRIPLIGVALIPGAIMFYGYIATRYTSELIPLLALGSAVGYVDLSRRLSSQRQRRRQGAIAVMAGIATFSLLANLALAVGTERTANPGVPLQQLVKVQMRLSDKTPGHPFDDDVHLVDELPAYGPADEIAVVGDCDLMAYGLGDPLRPWALMTARELVWQVTVPDDVTHATRIPLARSTEEGTVHEMGIGVRPDGRVRGYYDNGRRIRVGPYRKISEDGVINLRLATDANRQLYALLDADRPEPGLIEAPAIDIVRLQEDLRRPVYFQPVDELPEGFTASVRRLDPEQICNDVRSHATP